MNNSNILAIVALMALIGLIWFNAAYAQPLDIRLAKIYIGENAGDQFSSGIGAAGDINGDGYNDFLIGARFWGPGDNHYGRAYVYLGGDTLPDEPALILENGSTEQVFGYALHRIGDLNSDGYDDYGIVSTGLGAGQGALSIFLGSDTLKSQPHVVLRGSLDFQNYGISFAGGDLNNDGFDDLAVGAPFGAPVGQLGRVYVYFGSDSFDTGQDWVTFAVDEYFKYGSNVEIGDLNVDGIDDLVIGDVNTDSDSGNIHIFFGGDIFDTVEDVTIVSDSGSIGPNFDVGDINCDNIADLIEYDFSTNSQLIFFGGSDFDNIPDDILNTDDWDGSIGHVNKDGCTDLLRADANEGVIRIYRGGAPFDHQPDFVAAMGPFFTGFGGDIVAIGDVNGDGAGDILVSESSGGDVTFPEGQAYIYFGDTSFVVSVAPEPATLPVSYLSLQAYPNPFNASATIEYRIGIRGHVILSVYNLRGRIIDIVVDSVKDSGTYTIELDGSNLSSGIYFVRLVIGRESKVSKLLLLK